MKKYNRPDVYTMDIRMCGVIATSGIDLDEDELLENGGKINTPEDIIN